MLEKNNLIVIYGKGGSYKSSLGVSILNNYDNSCYINLDKKSKKYYITNLSKIKVEISGRYMLNVWFSVAVLEGLIGFCIAF